MDQADGLREMVQKKAQGIDMGNKIKVPFGESVSTRAISVASGKGGVGKTNIVGNLAISFGRLGKRVLVLDG